MIRSAPTKVLALGLLIALVSACGERTGESASGPDPAASRLKMARTLLNQGLIPEGLDQLRRISDDPRHAIRPGHQPEWFESIISQLILRRALDPADSMLALTGPVADRPARLQALSANLMVLEGDREGAIATWAAIRTDDPELQIEVHHELATLYMMIGRPEEAQNQAREGLSLDPERWQLRLLLADALLMAGNPDAALEEVQRLEPGVARWQIEARIQLEGFDRPDQAVTLLGLAHRASPRNPDIRLALARAHAANGQWLEARVLAEPLANLPVPFTGSRELLVEIYEATGEQQAAARLRDELKIEAEVGEATMLRVGGLQASMEGKLEVALELFDRGLAIDPEHADLHNDRGAVLARMERYEEAEAAFLEAVRLAPDDPTVQENLARLYQRTDQPELRDAAIARWQELTGGEAPSP